MILSREKYLSVLHIRQIYSQNDVQEAKCSASFISPRKLLPLIDLARHKDTGPDSNALAFLLSINASFYPRLRRYSTPLFSYFR